ncbi:MAG TPA: AAA family ATPase, partial [Thermotogota bacterium]|nr:AAA family ATPase [Thermotogota bacterium]
MRILSIRFKNLNSLAGEWEIDLTASPYRVDGIFAITGPTGAGKSTLLDALCLALYGRTPRLKAISDSGNEIMSKHQFECFAEATFEVEKSGCKRRYRAYWAQHRARKATDGPLQPPRREIADADSGNVLETKISDAARLIESQTGMDFDRFTRSMLLAQGEFTTFLKATPAERAPILEQITGTEIYSRISIVVHERRVLEDKRLGELKAACAGIRALSPEEESELRTGLTNGRKELETLKEQIAANSEKSEWRQGLINLEHRKTETDRQLQMLRAEEKAFEPDRIRLERANRALPLQGDLAVLTTFRTDQNIDIRQSENYRSSLLTLGKDVQEAERETEDFQNRLNMARTEKERGLRLITRIRALDFQIKEADRRIGTLETDIQRVRGLIRQYSDTRRKKSKALEACRDEDQKLVRWFSDNRSDERLGENILAIRQSAVTFKEIFGKIRTLEETLNQSREQHLSAENTKVKCVETQHDVTERLEKAKMEESEHIALIEIKLKGRALSERRSEMDRQKNRKNWLERLIEPLNRIIEAEDRLIEIESLSEKTARLYSETQKALALTIEVKETTEKSAEVLKALIARMQRIRDLDTERMKLEDNIPCPLCGALEHPYAHGNIPVPDQKEVELDAANQEIRRLSQEIEKQNRAIASIEAEQKHRTVEKAEKENALLKDQQMCAGLYEKLEIEPLGDPRQSLKRVTALLEETTSTIGREAAEIADLESEETRAKGLRQTVTFLSEAARQAEKDMAAALQEESLSQQRTEQTAQTLEEQRRTYDETRVKLIGALSPYGYQEVSPGEVDQVLSALGERKKRWDDSKNRKEALSKNLLEIQTEIANLTETLALRESEVSEKEVEEKAIASEREKLAQSRREQFQDKDTDQEEKHLTEGAESAEKKLDEARAVYNRRIADQQTTRELMEQLDKTVLKREKEIETKDAEFKKKMAAAGFNDETDFLSSQMEEQHRLDLNRRSEAIREKSAYLQETLRKWQKELEAQSERQLTDASLEALLSESTLLEERRQSLQEQIGALQQRLRAHEQAVEERAGQLSAIEAQKRELARWEELHSLIGSADGKKFRNFAQGLTFVTMVGHANEQLRKLTDRYLLSCEKNASLELNVQDLYQAGVSRSTKNLSGGESFLVSLALALGLSQMSSRNVRVDSLFLDEGFGTLDEEALETALETLSGLRQEGKLIGVISHVSGIKERIPVQIEVIPI